MDGADAVYADIAQLIAQMARTTSHRQRQCLIQDALPINATQSRAVVAFLHHADATLRECAIIVAHRAHLTCLVPHLTHLLHDDNALNVRVRSAYALGHLAPVGDVLVCHALRNAFADEESDVRYKAVYAFGEVATPNSDNVDVLLSLLQDEVWYVRHATLKALHKLCPQTSQPYLQKALGDKSARVRQTAYKLIGSKV
jgi:HEAT repeat protein